MSNSIKIYTKTGDSGETGLFGGARVSKDDLRIEAYGTVDELNSFIGLLRDHLNDHEQYELLGEIQRKLFTIGSLLAIDPSTDIKLPGLEVDDITRLEDAIDYLESTLSPLKNFILPGGHPFVSICHINRSVCRRAERRVVSLSKLNPVDPLILKYLNRLSDYFFTLARRIGKDFNAKESKWIN